MILLFACNGKIYNATILPLNEDQMQQIGFAFKLIPRKNAPIFDQDWMQKCSFKMWTTNI